MGLHDPKSFWNLFKVWQMSFPSLYRYSENERLNPSISSGKALSRSNHDAFLEERVPRATQPPSRATMIPRFDTANLFHTI